MTSERSRMRDDMILVAIAYHSGHGHTRRQAEAVVRGAASVPGARAELHDVSELSDRLRDALDGADAIVFGAPTYMGSPSSVFKAFAEDTVKQWGDGMRWKDKIAAGFTNSANMNGDKLNSLFDLVILAAQHGMHWVSLGLYPGWNSSTGGPEDLNRLGSWLGAMAQSNGDEGPDTAPPDSDLRTPKNSARAWPPSPYSGSTAAGQHRGRIYRRVFRPVPDKLWWLHHHPPGRNHRAPRSVRR